MNSSANPKWCGGLKIGEMFDLYLPKVNNWTLHLHIYQQWTTEHGICIFTNSEQLNMAFVRCSIGNRKKLCILMREPWRQRGWDRERERRMDGFPLIELFHNKVTRLATFPQPTLQGLQGLQGLPSQKPLQKSCEKTERPHAKRAAKSTGEI